jgi:ABC-type dipeptide/oligopeptide/nickel transport system permease component
MPGDPAQVIAGEYASADDVARIRQELGLDKGLLVRYGHTLAGMCVLDFGFSIYTRQPVWQEILRRLPATMALALAAMLLAAITGVLAGMGCAVWRGSRFDRAVLAASSLFVATPVFVTCIVLTLVFSFLLGIFPPSGMESFSPRFLVLPACALGSRSLALIIRVTRNEMAGVLDRQYITAARAGGHSEWRIISRYALANTLVPVATVILLDFGSYLGGAVVTETVFAWPGVGRLLVTALLKRDVPVVQGVVLFGTFGFIAIGRIISLLQARRRRAECEL